MWGMQPDLGLSMESESAALEALNRVAKSGCLDAMSVPADCPAVRFAVETAAWDLHNGGRGLVADSPFARGERAIDINGLVWMGPIDDMLSQFEDLVERGFTTLKCKVGAHNWQRELDMLQRVRERCPSDRFTLRVDANGAFSKVSLDDARARLEAWPLWRSTASNSPAPRRPRRPCHLCAEGILPIALDESLIGVHALTDRMRLLDHVKPQHLVLKPSLVGGLDSATVWSRLAEQRGMSWWATSALESNVGLSAIAQWAAVHPALNQPSPLPQGLGTGGLFVNNVPSNMSVGAGTLAVTSNVARDEAAWRLALHDAVRHDPGCGCGTNHSTS